MRGLKISTGGVTVNEAVAALKKQFKLIGSNQKKENKMNNVISYYKVFELLEGSVDESQHIPKPTIIMHEMYDGEKFPSKAAIKRRLSFDINDNTREFVIKEVITVDI